MRNRMVALAFVAVGLTAPIEMARALMIAPPPGPVRIVNSDAVFVGRVTQISRMTATPLIAESLDLLPGIEHWTVMVQREVADRFFAVPSTKAYGAVSVLVQLVAERTGFHPVSPTVFRPRPNVDSALVAFRRTGLPPDFRRVKHIVEGSFAHRRKRLANSLELAGVAPRGRAEDAIATIGRAPNVRAEELAPVEFLALAEALT